MDVNFAPVWQVWRSPLVLGTESVPDTEPEHPRLSLFCRWILSARAACLFRAFLLCWCATTLASAAFSFQVGLKLQPGEMTAPGSNIPADKIAQTVAEARQEIAQNPRAARAYLQLGAALREAGDYEAATKSLDQALALDPRLGDAWLEKGLVALQTGTLTQATELFREAVEANPGSVPAQIQLAAMLLRHGDFKKAQAHLEAALRVNPRDASAWDGLGLIQMQQAHPRAAVEDFRKAISFRSPYPEAQENLGQALLRLGDWAQARAAFEIALSGKLADASMATYGLATALKHLGENSQAETAFARARELMRQQIVLDRAQNENDRGLALWYQGDLEGARSAFEHALAEDPSYAEAHNNLGGVLWQMKDAAGAEKQFAAAVQANPSFAKARNNLANVLLDEGQLDQAIQQLRSALAAAPGFASAHLNLGIALMKKGRNADAKSEIQQALALDPEMAQAHIQMGLLLVAESKGLTRAARGELETGLRLNPQLRFAIPTPVYEELILGD